MNYETDKMVITDKTPVWSEDLTSTFKTKVVDVPHHITVVRTQDYPIQGERFTVYYYMGDKSCTLVVVIPDGLTVSMNWHAVLDYLLEHASAVFLQNHECDSVVVDVFKTRLRKALSQPVPAPIDFVKLEPSDIPSASRNLPGVDSMVLYPCGCHRQGRVWDIIQHLNDSHAEWTREKIADWLDDLADKGEIDIDFSTPDDVNFDREAVNKRG